MSGQAILIAALSGRALAAAARRAGYVPYVVDGFGDEDTRELAAASRLAPQVSRRGFTAKTLLPLLDELTEEMLCEGHMPHGLVLGAGFEDRPKLIETVSRTQQLLGCGAQTVFAAKDPGTFFNLLTDKGVRFPPTQLEAPDADASAGWLSKRIGGSGGRHVRRLSDSRAGRRLRYYQREIGGTVVSATALVSLQGAAFAFAQPWCAPGAHEPFRYGGIVGIDQLDADLEARLIDICRPLISALALIGLVSFDFIVDDDGEIFLLEINPRPGASLDIFDDAHGTLFAAHVAACTGRDGVALVSAKWRPTPRAAAYLYADAGAITINRDDWPDWVADRPQSGAEIPAGAPIATVIGEGGSDKEAASLCRNRLDQLAALLYERSSGA